MIKIKKGKVYVNGKETTDPSLIGFAVLDLAEKSNTLNDICVDFEEVKQNQ